MSTNYMKVVAGLILYCIGINFAAAQSGPEFLNCPSSPISLCVNDPGVRLPANNQIYLGEEDLNASSCSVHITQSIKVKSNCGKQLQYGVQLIIDDTSGSYTLQPLTMVTTDSLKEAELIFNTELSPINFIRENGLPYNTGCLAYHRIKWIVIDSCGNINDCEQLIDLYDCQPFVDSLPISLTNIIIPVGGQITLYAQDFIGHPLDDCSKSGEFSFSFSRDQYQPTYTYHCCNIPAYGVEVPLTFWVADKGRDLNCDNKIEWEERAKDSIVVQVVFTDNANPCDCEDDISIQGQITTEDVQTVAKVSVNLLSPGHLYPTYITAEDGKYVFTHVVVPADVTVTAERNDNHKNGVSTLDLLRIQKHLLGIEPFNNPYDLIAADANNSQNVSAIDLVELRKLILGRYDELPNNQSWRFIDKNYAIEDTTDPWPIRGYIPLSITNTVTNADFIAIKVGDVNNTVNPKAQALITRESLPLLPLTISSKEYETNEIINFDFSINDLKSLNGFQFTLSDPDLEFLGVYSDMIEIEEDDYVLFGDKMTMSWFDLDDVAIHPDDIVFTIKAITKKRGSLQQTLQMNSDITEAELYGASEDIFIPKLLFNSNSEDQLILFPVEPNPWSNDCNIPFRLTTASNVLLTVYSMDGSQIFSEEKFYSPGYHEINLNAGNISSTGLLFFTLQSAEGMQSGKMFLVK